MWIPQFIWKWIGHEAADKIGLKEGGMEGSKPWYKSQGVWTGIITFLIGTYSLASTSLGPSFGLHIPAIPEWIFTILGAMGIYSRVTATKTIG